MYDMCPLQLAAAYSVSQGIVGISIELLVGGGGSRAGSGEAIMMISAMSDNEC